MATTMKLIAKTTLGSDAASVTIGSSGTIPATYTDLLLVCALRSSRADHFDLVKVRFNAAANDNNLTARELYGSGSSTASATYSTYAYVGSIPANTADANTLGSLEIYVPNYAGSTNKSFSTTYAQERNNSTAYVGAVAGLWSSTNAINEITLLTVNGSLKADSTVYLYGITKA